MFGYFARVTRAASNDVISLELHAASIFVIGRPIQVKYDTTTYTYIPAARLPWAVNDRRVVRPDCLSRSQRPDSLLPRAPRCATLGGDDVRRIRVRRSNGLDRASGAKNTPDVPARAARGAVHVAAREREILTALAHDRDVGGAELPLPEVRAGRPIGGRAVRDEAAAIRCALRHDRLLACPRATAAAAADMAARSAVVHVVVEARARRSASNRARGAPPSVPASVAASPVVPSGVASLPPPPSGAPASGPAGMSSMSRIALQPPRMSASAPSEVSPILSSQSSQSPLEHEPAHRRAERRRDAEVEVLAVVVCARPRAPRHRPQMQSSMPLAALCAAPRSSSARPRSAQAAALHASLAADYFELALKPNTAPSPRPTTPAPPTMSPAVRARSRCRRASRRAVDRRALTLTAVRSRPLASFTSKTIVGMAALMSATRLEHSSRTSAGHVAQAHVAACARAARSLCSPGARVTTRSRRGSRPSWGSPRARCLVRYRGRWQRERARHRVGACGACAASCKPRTSEKTAFFARTKHAGRPVRRPCERRALAAARRP